MFITTVKYLWYEFLRAFVWLIALFYFRIRVSGTNRIPQTGPVLIVSNHQSHLDPLMVGVVSKRHMNFVARKTLFKFPPFRWLLSSVGSIPLDRDGMGIEGIKQTLKRLKANQMVLIFPEGTRSRDGEMQTLKPGFLSLVRRTDAVITPVAISGVFECWPRSRNFPSPGKVNVEFGSVITLDEIKSMNDEQLMQEVERRVRECFENARKKRTERM